MSAIELSPTTFIIDDDAAIRESVVTTLRPVKVQTECYQSAEDFLDRWGGPRPGCVLLDVRMPGMSGIELLHILRHEHPYLSVVIVTGHATVSQSVDSMKRGAVDFLEKPYLPDDLRKIVVKSVQRSVELWSQQMRENDYQSRKSQLSPRENEVYRYLLDGKEAKQIAAILEISVSTVEKHRIAVLRKMAAQNTTQLLSQKYNAVGNQ